MFTNSWKSINSKIEECFFGRTPQEAVVRLKQLFERTNDGMVALKLGQSLFELNELEQALQYATEAEQLFPKEEWKEKARGLARSIRARMVDTPPSTKNSFSDHPSDAVPSLARVNDSEKESTICIVGCTKKKVWDVSPSAPDFVPARYAYQGTDFIKFMQWLALTEAEKRGFEWVILSGKYGFIDPWHPIGPYDIHLAKPEDSPMPIEGLIAQTLQRRTSLGHDPRICDRLVDYRVIQYFGCSEEYRKVIYACFPEARILPLNIE